MRRAVFVCLVAVACTRASPRPALGPSERAPVHVPPGCEQPLEGTYVHELNPAYRYAATDDGGTLVLWLELRLPDGGAAPPPSDGGETRVELERTPEGFHGSVRATAFTAANRPCAVDFATEVVACVDGGLQLRTLSSRALDDACQSPDSGVRQLETHSLIRVR